MRLATVPFMAVGLLLGVLTPAEGSSSAAAVSHRASSVYVAMRDGTRLAVDVWLPAADARPGPMPAIVQFTRYWRAFRSTGRSVTPDADRVIDFFNASGYAVVVVDVRGTGASFGMRSTEFSDAEVQDYGDVIDWVAAHPWSNGRVATMGSSYLGNAAELAAIPARAALRAVVPRFSDFSEYRHAIRPGGIKNSVIADAWVSFTRALDRNDGCEAFGAGTPCDQRAPWATGVKPVDADPDGRLLAGAIAEHEQNADLRRIVAGIVYSDDPFEEGNGDRATLDAVSPSGRWPQIDRAGVPAFHWASWFDGGTATGVLTRFASYRSPMQVVIGAWSHGGGSDADPYRHGSDPASPLPSIEAQLNMIRAFLDPLLGSDARPPIRMRREVRYLTVGPNTWHSTDVWPPRGVKEERWYLLDRRALGTDTAQVPAALDAYTVDFLASTGTRNRWHTQLGIPVWYGDVSEADRRRLTYMSAPLSHDTEITGTPVAELALGTTATDGAVFVYLEDVAPDGRVTYLTEGQLRLLFPKSVSNSGPYTALGSSPSFDRVAARAPVPNEVRRYRFAMNPISVIVRRGHRLRVAIAGADADTFERLPVDGPPPQLTISRGAAIPSFVTLPIRK